MHPMKAALVTLLVAACLAAAGIACAGTASPVFGARLSGMGEHGIVNLRAKPAHHELCWSFDLHTKGVTHASLRDAHGMVVAKLGTAYARNGCAMVAPKALALVEHNPTKYWVWVDTKGHPGDLRGKLVRGMIHM
jgi:hypothetical protein